MEFKKYRPKGYLQREEEEFVSLTKELQVILDDTSFSLHNQALKFNYEKHEIIAHLIIEFAEDINLDIGIWNAYENYNLNTFGTPLTCTLEPGQIISRDDKFNEFRILHFLWNIYSLLIPDLILSPWHEDLVFLAQEVTSFLNNAKHRFPKHSTIKEFLKESEHDAYDIKRKLIWLGTKSYFFRENYKQFLKKYNYKEEIAVIDDFINQITTSWSGLSATDILPELLIIPQRLKNDLKSWYERHLAYYHVKSVRASKLFAENIINNKTYRIINGSKDNPFVEGDLIFGSTVKYGDDWYWSGGQKRFSEMTQDQIKEIREDFIEKTSKVAYRYEKDLLEKAQTRTKEFYNEFVSQYGDDLVEFTDGLNFFASLQKKQRENYEKLAKEKPEEYVEFENKHNIKNNSPNFVVPKELLDSENGVAVFFNINEGHEILNNFNSFKEALIKKGKNLTSDDFDLIHSLIEDPCISPAFIKKLMGQYGTGSILEAYMLNNENDIEYLLHKHKGQFYKQRYPTLTIN